MFVKLTDSLPGTAYLNLDCVAFISTRFVRSEHLPGTQRLQAIVHLTKGLDQWLLFPTEGRESGGPDIAEIQLGAADSRNLLAAVSAEKEEIIIPFRRNAT